MKRLQRLAAGAAVLSLAAATGAAADTATFDIQDRHQDAATETLLPGPVHSVLERGRALDQTLHAPGDAARFYARQGGEAVWTARGRLTAEARALIETISDARAHGLEPAHYHLAALEAAANGRLDEAQAAELDVLLTDAFLRLASHLLNGRVDPAALSGTVEFAPEARDLTLDLDAALDRGPARAIASIAPSHPQYAMLQAEFVRYSEAAERGEWPRVDDGATLREGDIDPRVAQIRARLDAEDAFMAETPGADEGAGGLFSGLFGRADAGPSTRPVRNSRSGFTPITYEMEPAEQVPVTEIPAVESLGAVSVSADPNEFDIALAERVKQFQQRHGLAADGVVGAATMAMLNTGLAERAQTIQMNLERWRWLPNDLGERYILVNTPSYRLHAHENGRESLTMDVIVGRPSRQTPQFSDAMRFMVVNPDWNVPYSIATLDKLPQLRSDPGYFDRMGYRIYDRNGSRVSPHAVNWHNYSRGNFPFRMMQEPGPYNAMGTIKFMFPNEHNVYLHDTENPSLFGRDERGLSSGCVRVSDPRGLAHWIVDGDPELTRGQLDAAWDSGRTQTVNLGERLPVHLAYFTVWADEDGAAQIYADLYDKDDRLRAAFSAAS